jgi:hypothetical protein
MLDGAISLASFSRRVGRERLIALCKDPRADGNVPRGEKTVAAAASRTALGARHHTRGAKNSLCCAIFLATSQRLAAQSSPPTARLSVIRYTRARANKASCRGRSARLRPRQRRVRDAQSSVVRTPPAEPEGRPFDHERELSQTRHGHGPALRVPRRSQRIGYRHLETRINKIELPSLAVIRRSCIVESIQQMCLWTTSV